MSEEFSDESLHASFSRHTMDASASKALSAIAKRSGFTGVDVWRHNGGWAIRYTLPTGETRQTVLGRNFSAAQLSLRKLAQSGREATKLKRRLKATASLSISSTGEISASVDGIRGCGHSCEAVMMSLYDQGLDPLNDLGHTRFERALSRNEVTLRGGTYYYKGRAIGRNASTARSAYLDAKR